MKRILMLVFASFMVISSNYAQESQATNENPLAGLTKANLTDLDPSTPLMLDGISTPVYTENLTLMKGNDLIKAMSSGDYFPEVYLDSNKDVKALVLKKATELEKSQMMIKNTNSEMPEKSNLIGKQALPFSVTDINGKNYSLESLKGKVIVINFWFVECKPCVMEMPELNKLVEKYENKDVVFLGLAINQKDKIEQFLKKTTYKYNTVPAANDVIDTYGVTSFPMHIVIDKNSNVTFAANGLGPTTIDDLDKKIGSLLD